MGVQRDESRMVMFFISPISVFRLDDMKPHGVCHLNFYPFIHLVYEREAA